MLLRRREYPDSLFSQIQNPPEQQKNKQKINKGVNSDVLSCPHALGPPCVTHHRKPRLLLLLGLVRSESHLEQVRRRTGGWLASSSVRSDPFPPRALPPGAPEILKPAGGSGGGGHDRLFMLARKRCAHHSSRSIGTKSARGNKTG